MTFATTPKIDVDTASRDRLVEYIDHLEYRLSMVWPSDADVIDIMRVIGCARQVASALACFLKARVVTVEHLQVACATCGDEPSVRHIAVLITRLRNALRPHGVTLEVVWGRGYQISADSARRLQDLITERAAA